MNSSPMILRFASGSVTSASLSRKRPADVHVDERHVGVLAERLDDLLGLVMPEEAVVDEDARQIVADGPVDEHRRRRGIDPAGEPADGPRLSDLVPYPLDRVGNDVDRRPLGPAAAGLEEEVLEDLHPVLRVPDLGMELDPETALLPVFERDDGDRGRLGGDLEAFREGEDGVSVARPGLLLVGRAGEEALVALDDQVGAAVLPDLDGPHLPALDERHELHPVTDAEHRNSEVEEVRLHARSALLVDAVGTAREDDALGVLGPYLLYGRVIRDHLRVDAAFPDAARDQLRVLPSEVEYQDHGSLPWRILVIFPFRRLGSAARSCLRSPGTARTLPRPSGIPLCSGSPSSPCSSSGRP